MGLIPNQIFPENAYGKAMGRPKKYSRGVGFFVAEVIAGIPELIEQGEKLMWGNFRR